MSAPKLHHIVPKFYLKRFTKDDVVELVDRHDLDKSFPVNPKKAVAETHYYSVVTDQGARDPVAENLFAREIESPAAEAIRRIRTVLPVADGFAWRV